MSGALGGAFIFTRVYPRYLHNTGVNAWVPNRPPGVVTQVLNTLLCCRSLGCLDPQCSLCEHNPHRRCNVNFAPKYLVNDLLKAKCDAPIRVEIIDRATGVPLGEDIADLQLEGALLTPKNPTHRASRMQLATHAPSA